MRLWHEALIPYLPRQQLLGQHRECCALRGNGWGKPHATVNYVFKHPRIMLVVYHTRVMHEMERRGYTPEYSWWDLGYRGKQCEPDSVQYVCDMMDYCTVYPVPIYPEHDDDYLRECLDNLRNKGIILEGFDYERVGL